jgi:hypothetical protein
MWVRNFDTHQTVVVADMGDSFTDYFTEMFGTLSGDHSPICPSREVITVAPTTTLS